VQSAQTEVCPSCGIKLTVHASRCPACGFLLASAPGPVYQNSLPPKRPRPLAVPRSRLPIVVALVGVGLTAAIASIGFWLVRQRDEQRAALPAASALRAPPPASTPPAVELEPTTLFAKAKAAALAWHTDAALVEIDIGPVTAGKVEPDGKLVFLFGKPAGKKLGPGTAVQALGFLVTADQNGLRGDEHSMAKAVSAAEPNCIFEDVLGKLSKAGVPSTERLHLHYAMSDKSARGVWRVARADGEREGPTLRALDGSNCAIIVR
jgi:hypothetical protein